MAYSRWGVSKWYCFWYYTNAERKEDEYLALWKAGVDFKKLRLFKYDEVKRMLEDEDFSIVPGYNENEDKEFLKYICKLWLQDMEEEWKCS